MNATIGVMTKRINSTKQTFSGSSHNVVLKDPVSRENPTLLVTGAPMAKSNYMKWNGWYYWIDDIVSETNNMYRVVAHVDPLATWKDDIKAAKGFCNFGPKSKYNKKILDSRLNPDMMVIAGHQDVSFSKFSKTGSVILRVVDYPVGGVSGSGGVQTICGSISSFNQLLQTYCTDLDADLSNLQTDFEKLMGKFAGLGNALDNIKSAFWVPIDLSEIAGNAYGGNIGGYNISGTWYWVSAWSGYPITEQKTVTISLDSKIQTYPWLIHPKYLHLEMTSPGGKVDLSSASYIMLNTSSIELQVLYGMNINGDGYLTVMDDDNGVIINHQEWNCAIDLLNYVYKAKSAVLAGISAGAKIGAAGVAGIAAAGAVATSVGSAVAEVGLAIGSEIMMNVGLDMMGGNKMNVQSVVSGIQGVAAATDIAVANPLFGASESLNGYYIYSDSASTWCRIEKKCYMPRCIMDDTYEDFCDEYGWPVLNYVSPNVDGHYQFAGMNVEADAPQSALSTINSTCNSLIYIE